MLSSQGPEGTVYSFRPDAPSAPLTVLPLQPTAARPGARVALPVGYWVNGEFRDQLDPANLQYATLSDLFARDVTATKEKQFVSPDGSLILPAGRVFQQAPDDSYPVMTTAAGAGLTI